MGQGKELSSGQGEGQGQGENPIIAHQAEGGEVQLSMTHRYSHKLKDRPIEENVAKENGP